MDSHGWDACVDDEHRVASDKKKKGERNYLKRVRASASSRSSSACCEDAELQGLHILLDEDSALAAAWCGATR